MLSFINLSKNGECYKLYKICFKIYSDGPTLKISLGSQIPVNIFQLSLFGLQISYIEYIYLIHLAK